MPCNECDSITFNGRTPAYRRALIAVFLINFVMFLVEAVGGHLSGSRALWADSLDFLGDSITYAMSLWAINKPLQWRASVALIKSASLAVMGLVVLVMAVLRAFNPAPPEASLMGGIAVAALLANLTSVVLLMRYRDGDANVRSVWLCSRNDAIGNIGVIAAAIMVAATNSPWPDIIVAALMAFLFISSGTRIAIQARGEWRQVLEAEKEKAR